MDTIADDSERTTAYPVDVRVDLQMEDRDRLTTAFRFILALPHLLLVGGPIGAALTWTWGSDDGSGLDLGASGGLLGAVAGLVAMIAWFAILFTGRYPRGLYDLVVYYLRWRTHAVAYVALLRDEYPPFGDGPYPMELELVEPEGKRNRLTVAFRLLLAIPHLFVVSLLQVAWGFTTLFGWFAILILGDFPRTPYAFGVGVLRWSIRVEAYVLLLVDEYPPFSLK